MDNIEVTFRPKRQQYTFEQVVELMQNDLTESQVRDIILRTPDLERTKLQNYLKKVIIDYD